MAAEDQDSRTYEPSGKRLEEARRRDETAESAEVRTVAVVVAALAVGCWLVPKIITQHSSNVRVWLTMMGTLDVSTGTIGTILGHATEQTAIFALPIIAATVVAGCGAQIAQVGFRVQIDRLKPKFNALNPVNGLKSLFSTESLVLLGKAALKLVLVGYVAYRVVLKSATGAEALVALSLPDILGFIGRGVFRTIAWVAAALALVAAIDFLYEFVRCKKKLKMTRQEVKDETKDTEGNPEIKQRFSTLRYRLTRNRMLAAVPTADVVLTNPVHVAVALRYVADVMRAPQVVAKGAGELAEQMKAAARRVGVPIIERRALARALFRSVKVGQEIPAALYRAVAEVLAYIYSLRRPSAARQEAR
jgi:flagellar biosynthetic protein FlhB